MSTVSNAEMLTIAAQLRYNVIRLSHERRIAHLASCLSAADILTVLYWQVLQIDPQQPAATDRDRFILSKGHAAAALYWALALRGFFDPNLIADIGKPGSPLEEHPALQCVPGVEASTGSLGHGLSIGTGLALGSRINGVSYKVYVLLSDGECNEGTVWEAAMFAAGKSLTNLTAIVDFNRWQATGRSCEVLALQPLREKWQAFGWDAVEIDGHNIEEISQALQEPAKRTRPRAIVANTVKGKGVSFMEDDNNWHYRIPTEEEVALAGRELGVL